MSRACAATISNTSPAPWRRCSERLAPLADRPAGRAGSAAHPNPVLDVLHAGAGVDEVLDVVLHAPLGNRPLERHQSALHAHPHIAHIEALAREVAHVELLDRLGEPLADVLPDALVG